MLAGDYLDLVRQMPVVTCQELTRGLPFVILSPHPDDETLGAGGLLCQARAGALDAFVIVLTDGSGSHPRSKLYPRDALIALRKAEVDKAASLLGISPNRIRHLGLRDTQAPKSGVAFDAAVAEIADVVRSTDAKSLFATWEHDPHCDHEAAAMLAKAVRKLLPDIRLWAYPIWGWHLDPSTEIKSSPLGVRIDVSRQFAVKSAAIAAHASQMTDLVDDDPDGFCFSQTTLAPFLGRYEYFIEVPE